MSSENSRPLKEGEVECRVCGVRYVPDFYRDYYGGENGRGGRCESCMMSDSFKKAGPVDVTDEKQLEEVCRRGKGHEACRYLMMGPGFACAKGSDVQPVIDQRVGEMRSQGDNCSGPPDFQLIVPTPE